MPRKDLEASITLEPGRTGTNEYLPGETVKGVVRVTAKESTSAISSIFIRLTGNEYIWRGREKLPVEVYYQRTLTLAGMETEAECTERTLRLERLEKYMVKNGKNALTGLVLDTHTDSYQEYLSGERQEPGVSPERRGLPDGMLGQVLGQELRVEYPMKVPYTTEKAKSTTISLQTGLEYEFPFAVLLPPWCPPSFSFTTPEATGVLQYELGLFVIQRDITRDAALLQKLFVVKSVVPKRELLQAQERPGIRPLLSVSQRFRTFKKNPVSRFFQSAPKGVIEVKVSFLGSSCIVLRDTEDRAVKRLISPNHSLSSQSAPEIGTTVMGAVVGAPSAAVQSTDSNTSRTFYPVKTLRLRVKVANGGFRPSGNVNGDTIKGVDVELMARVRVRGRGDLSDTTGHTIRLAKQHFEGSIPYGASNKFDVSLTLPPRFSRATTKEVKSLARWRNTEKEEDTVLPPPVGIRTSRVDVSCFIQVSFPGLRTLQEEVLPDDIVTLCEAVDFNDIVPYLPSAYEPETFI